MNGRIGGLILVASCVALLAGGCAKQAEVKKDEGIAPLAGTKTQAEPGKDVAAPAVTQKQADSPMVQTSVPHNSVVVEAKPEPVAREVAKEEAALQQGLSTVYFGFDSPKLSEDARDVLVKDANLLKKFPKGKVRVEGNCDERGSDDYNLALGEKRAKEAVQYLVNLGIPQDRLTSISYGKEKPAAPGHDEASWAKNRRDDFVVSP